MNELRFQWDEDKNRRNKRKHGISFEEARTAFYDDNARLFFDPDHSEEEEERFILLGLSMAANILIVCHCYREGDEIIRIISARPADKQEEEDYWSENQ